MVLKICTVFGTRPEAIKMCPLIKQMHKTEGIDCRVILTGQHREMLSQVTSVFGIKADYNLNIMKEGQTLQSITVDVLNGISEIIMKENPELVLVHGDTTTSFAAALAAFYSGVPVGHVEAGLRTYNMRSPYPEELNRQTVDLITDLYFAPTETARDTLLKEGKPESKIFVTGNTVIDALSTTIRPDYSNPLLEWALDSRLILVTAHRRENLGEPMRGMFKAIRRIADDFKDVKILYPIHKNPKVREIAAEELEDADNIRLIEPLDVFDFHNFMARSYFIMTDSGGIQEEAPSLGKPVLVMRDTTERPEGIKAGTLKLTGTDQDSIYSAAALLLNDSAEYSRMSRASNPYGDGHASERIAEAIIKHFEVK